MAHATTVNLERLATVVRRRGAALMRLAQRAGRGEGRAVHQARVVSRRIREALPVAAAVVGNAHARVRRDVRRLTDALGRVRELDVAMHRLDETAQGREWSAAAVQRVREHLRRERDRQRRHLRARLGHTDLGELGSNLRQLAKAVADAGDPGPGERLLASRVRERAAALRQVLQRVGTLYLPETLHAVRLAGKKLRYSLELSALVGAGGAARDVATLRTMQQRLGRMHDLQVLQAHVHLVAASPGADRTMTWTLQAMTAALDAECRALQAQFLRMRPELRALIARAGERAVARRPLKRVKMVRMQLTAPIRPRRLAR